MNKITLQHDIQNPVYFLLRHNPETRPDLFAQIADTTMAQILIYDGKDSGFAYNAGGVFVVMGEDAALIFTLKYSNIIKFTLTHEQITRGIIRLSHLFSKPLSMIQFLCDSKAAGQTKEFDIIMEHPGDILGIPEEYLPFLTEVDRLLNTIDDRE